jgi:hypothetical protein
MQVDKRIELAVCVKRLGVCVALNSPVSDIVRAANKNQ